MLGAGAVGPRNAPGLGREGARATGRAGRMHAMVRPRAPNMGQGAGLAIEDAACLAALLAEGGPADATLTTFEALR